MELPDTIKVTFTKEDRRNAKDYADSENCLMATALKRMGYNHSTPLFIGSCGMAYIGQSLYVPTADWGCHDVVKHFRVPGGPFYKRSVVGTTVTLVKEKRVTNAVI